MIDPEKDGIDHINIYSKGKTELGRFLSNFARAEINTPYGMFESVEGYWYYLLIPKFDIRGEQLKTLSGFKAKQLGKELTNGVDWEESQYFKDLICKAIKDKIVYNGLTYYGLFKQSTLPFKHYYNYGGKVVNVDRGQWIVEYITKLRKELND